LRRFCSFTATETAVAQLSISCIRPEIRSIAETAPVVACCTAMVSRAMSSVVVAVCTANDLTSEAAIAKPLPASPARAASIVALRASRLVCPAMARMSLFDDVGDLLRGLSQCCDLAICVVRLGLAD
jgi:hypothetical protein